MVPSVSARSDRPDSLPPESDDLDGQRVLAVLSDADCRTILAVADDDPLDAREIAARCDLSSSTTYRKLDRLVEAGLLAEQTAVGGEGPIRSVYRAAVAGVQVTRGGTGTLALAVHYRDDRSPVTVSLDG